MNAGRNSESSLNQETARGSASPQTLEIRTALKEAISRLRAAGVPSDTLAAEVLLMHTLGRDRTWIYTHAEDLVESSVADRFFSLVGRRAAGEPTQYLTGKQEFWGLEFEVTPAVLIPRPETEHVIEVALERLGPRGIKIRMDTGAPSPKLRVADVGTGSGCIAVALAYELPHADLFATDISEAALEIARHNALRHGVAERIDFLHADLLQPLLRGQQSFDLIVSNPPYISRREAPSLQREVVDHEPGIALFGGPRGIEIYERLIEEARILLRSGGFLVLELGHDSAKPVRAMLEKQFCWTKLSVTNDLAGIPRVIAAERAE